MVDAEMIKTASSFALTVYLKHYLKYPSGKSVYADQISKLKLTGRHNLKQLKIQNFTQSDN